MNLILFGMSLHVGQNLLLKIMEELYKHKMAIYINVRAKIELDIKGILE